MAQKTKGLAIVPMSASDRKKHAADVEADFTGRPQPFGTYDGAGDDGDDGDGKVSEQTAGYMELEGAEKGGDCDLVTVAGGVSPDKGCCNLFDPETGAAEFSCENCEHFTAKAAGPAAGASPAADEAAEEVA